MPNATAQDTYSVSKIRTSQGRQGEAWSASLLRNGKEIAQVINEANGGCLRVYWKDQMHGKSEEEERFNAFVEAEKAKIPADKISEEGSQIMGRPVLLRDECTPDICIENMVNKTLDDRRWKRMSKTKTLFQVGTKIGSDTIQILNGIGPAARAWVEKKFAGQKIRFLNDEYK